MAGAPVPPQGQPEPAPSGPSTPFDVGTPFSGSPIGPGRVPTGEPYVPQPPGTAPQTAEDKQASNLQARTQATLTQYGLKPDDSPMSYDETLDYLDQQGLDPSLPETMQFAQAIANGGVYTTFTSQTQAIASAGSSGGLQGLLKPVVPYQALVDSIGGIDDLLFPRPGGAVPYGGSKASTQGMRGGLATQPLHGTGEGYVDLADKGVLVWNNGVIVNYAPTTSGMPTGVVYDNGDATQEGSYAWQRAAQSNWSPDKVEAWRSKLFKAGYVSSKKGLWDQDLIEGTSAYYDMKYKFGAEVAEAGTGKPAAGATGRPTPADIAALIQKNTPTIHSTITDQYLTMFNEAPTADELQSWTSFITRTATDLATGQMNQRLTPDQAISQAQASMASKIFHSPQGQITFEAEKENTSLHDGLTTAITATRGLA